MLDIRLIRENPGKINELLKRRNKELSINEIIEFDEKRRKIQTKIDELRNTRKNCGQRSGYGSVVEKLTRCVMPWDF